MDCKIEIKDNLVYVDISGSITSQNALDFENVISSYPGDNNGVIIDTKNLSFISSAGLRVILSTKKRCKNKTFKIVNANKSIMDIFRVTGFDEIMDIEPAPRHIDVTGCKIIGRGACGECYRLDDETIIKLYYSKVSKEEINKEKDLAKKAFVMGVPTAISYDIVESEGRIGVVYELLNCKTLVELIREDTENSNLEEYVKMYVNVCKQVHSIDAGEEDIPSFKDLNRADIPNVTGITDEEREYLYKFLDMVPNRTTCIHGDLNPNNIMVQNGEGCLIDMGEFSTGMNLFDISRIMFSFVFSPDRTVEINDFYKLPHTTVDKIWHLFIKYYFGVETLEEVKTLSPDNEWLEPLAWFRCVTSMLKFNRWPEAKRNFALGLLREKLIPFIKSKSE